MIDIFEIALTKACARLNISKQEGKRLLLED